MAEQKEAGGKKKKKKGENVKIYARVRQLMPWEPRKVSLFVKGNKVRNKTPRSNNEYMFQKVFGTDIDNEVIFQSAVQPLIDNVLKGFNAIMIAYGQTGSGKTYSMLGKPNLNVEGLLPKMLRVLAETPTVKKVELSAVEAFGHHVARIELFDLFDERNQVTGWAQKRGNTSLDPLTATKVTITGSQDAHDKIIYAHAASHFAPTGKNPESSRGHVSFVAKCVQEDPEVEHGERTSFFVMVDCAGSEGESAFTKEFQQAVDKTTLMARRLEAGCINTGLSQLQIIFNELRYKGKLSNMVGNGLRRVLHPYINTRTFLSVLFTLSPSINNSKPTESTLKFAVTAGMVKVKPVKEEVSINLEKLVQQLRKHIEENDKLIDEQNDKIQQLQLELEQVRQEGISAGNLPVDFVVSDEKEEPASLAASPMGRSRAGTQALPDGLLKQLADLDAESDEEAYELDEMFAVEAQEVGSQDIEKEMQAALDRMQNVAKGTDLVRSAVGGGDGGGEQAKAAAADLAETIRLAQKDVVDAADEEERLREQQEAEAMFPQFQVDLDALDEEGLKVHVDETWERIDGNRAEQENLKKSQQTVVDHLVETNEWLFRELNEILNSSAGQ